MFEVVILTVEPYLTDSKFDSLLNLVSSEKQDRIKKFHFKRDAQNCLLGDILTRIEICNATNLRNKQLKFSVNVYGKPFLINCPNIHYNISHTSNYIALVLSDKPVGIDIEFVKSIDLRIAQRFFAPDETAYIMANNHKQRFYEIWTKKESRIKWEGKGLYKPLSSFSVINSAEQNKHEFYNVFENNKVVCHVCSTKQTTPFMRMFDTAELIQRVMIL